MRMLKCVVPLCSLPAGELIVGSMICLPVSESVGCVVVATTPAAAATAAAVAAAAADAADAADGTAAASDGGASEYVLVGST